jgi:hypothetical protein
MDIRLDQRSLNWPSFGLPHHELLYEQKNWTFSAEMSGLIVGSAHIVYGSAISFLGLFSLQKEQRASLETAEEGLGTMPMM